MIQIVYGRAGSGKSTFCFEEIKKSKTKKNFLITPEQFSFTAEQKLMETFGKDALITAEVITFKRMASRILKECGGVTSKVISENGKKMLLYDILLKEKNNLTFLGKSEENIELIDKTITELKKHCIKPDMLSKAIEKSKSERLRLKLKDIQKCYMLFEEKLGDNYITEPDLLNLLAEKIPKSNMFVNADVFIDEFSGFTVQEYNIITALLNVANKVVITMTSDDISNEREGNLFYNNTLTAQKLLRISNDNKVKIEKPIFLQDIHRFKSKALKEIERNIYSFGKFEANDDIDDVTLSINSNPYQEIEKIANHIVYLVKQYGYRYNDISIIAKDIESYGAIIKSVFRTYEIPTFIDEKKDLSQNIFIKFILSVLDILSKGWQTESVISSIKTGFYPISLQEQYELENYCLAWGIKGKKWYAEEFHYGIETNEEKQRINDIRKRVVRSNFRAKFQHRTC